MASISGRRSAAAGPPRRPGHDRAISDEGHPGRGGSTPVARRRCPPRAVDGHAEQADRRPRDQRLGPRPLRPPASSATRDTRTTADERERRSRRRPPAGGQAFEDEAGHDRDDRREDARHRRHDPHPPDREPVVQRRDADPAEDPGDDADQRVRPVGNGSRRGSPARPRGRHARRPARRGRRRTPAPVGWPARRRSRPRPRRAPRSARPRTTDGRDRPAGGRRSRLATPRRRVSSGASAGSSTPSSTSSGRAARRPHRPRRRSGRTSSGR